MRASTCTFGPREYIAGIWCEPDEALEPRKRPTFIFLNAGLVHRVGPSRAYVDMARELASEGFASLRFDHGGIGDSGNPRNTLPFEVVAAEEVCRAMDYAVSEHGSSSFVLVGLCSGARLALRVGASDARVVGIVSLDGQAFRTWRFWLDRYRSRGRSIGSYLALRLRMPGQKQIETAIPSLEVPNYSKPSKDEVAEDLQSLVRREVHQYWIFTGSFPHRYNHERQHRDAFPGVSFGDLLRLDYLPDAAHTLWRAGNKQLVESRMKEWAVGIWSPSTLPESAMAGAGASGSAP